MSTPLLGGVEAGGTKVVCAIGTGPDDIRHRATIPTTTPVRTLAEVIEFFSEHARRGQAVTALGVASFGPLDLDPASPQYGHITSTTKPGWAGTDIAGLLGRRLAVPVALDTDVNGAAYGEARWGAARGLHNAVYLTVGTGIGGGAVVAGRPLRGLIHTEMGHLHVQRHPDDSYRGGCPFHGDCVEGLASGPALAARLGRPAQDAGPDTSAVVAMQAFYLAQLITAITYLLSPQRIVLGGGVAQLPGLLDAVRAETVTRLGNALDAAAFTDDVDRYLTAPGLDDMSGVLGALGMAADLADSTRTAATPP
ncbi:ROK family protein [Catellatospora tritici]|uniref:ROK family protein n=1 Tax=Catellatospora tritici TaxID=2851566 RepID=UPI001C2CF32C|nr:ROK family protein [Catellatospora tritici]MBV1855188.1 ROK family protein [Catellatospora tritici]